MPFLLLSIIFFGEAFVSEEQFLFRDAAHFYYPLFHEVTRQWKAGEIPLWSPWDGLGMPLAADATPSVFYPGKVLLLTPLGFDFGMRLYVVLHLALAYGSIYFVARKWNCSTIASILAATAYAYGGPTLSYHANIIFLVGASWLPLALFWGWQLARRPALHSGTGLAFSLSMMVLGGDPQLAFHTMMMLTIAAIGFVLPWRRVDWRSWWQWRAFRVGSLVIAAAFAAGLAAIQILPTQQWASRSLRSTSDTPRNVFEWAAQPNKDPSALLGQPKAHTHALHSYDFSIGPWNWPNVFIANFSGKLYPRNERWIRAIPAEGRVWFPSLFMGTIATFLALYAFIYGCRRRLDRWILLMGLFGLIASLGWYGLGWIFIEIAHATVQNTDSLPVGSPLGGLYWAMNMLIPKYAQFRYPAKWWIFVSFALSLLAARGLDHLRINRSLGSVSALLAFLCMVAGLLGVIFSSSLSDLLPPTPNDPLFGPLDSTTGFFQMGMGLMAAGGAILVGVVCMSILPRHLRKTAIVVVTAIELAFGNAWLVQSAPQEIWQPLGFDSTSIPLELRHFRAANYFNRSDNTYPPHFATTGSDDRMVEGLKHDRANYYPRFHLIETIRFAPSVVSITPRDYETVWNLAKADPEVMRFLRDMHGIDWQTTHGAWPAAWWQPSVDSHRAIDKLPPEEQTDMTMALLEKLVQDDNPHTFLSLDWRVWPTTYIWESTKEFPVIVETETDSLPQTPLAPVGAKIETKLIRTRSGRLELHLTNCQPGWVVFREYFDPGWQCEIVDSKNTARSDVSIYRANRILMAVPVKRGDKKIVLTYWPHEFVAGMIISSISWLFFIGVLLIRPMKNLLSQR